MMPPRAFSVPMSVALLWLWLEGCGAPPRADEESGETFSARVHLVEMRVVPDVYEAAGTIRAHETARLSSKVQGRLRELRVGPGDRVSKGEIVALLEAEEISARERAAEAAAEEAGHARREAEAALRAAQAEADLAASTRERFAILKEKRAATLQELDEVEARYRGALAEKARAEARLLRAEAASSRAVSEARAAEALLEETRLRAPFEGRVLEKLLDVGNLASPGLPILVVEKAGVLRAEAPVTETHIGSIRLGDSAEVEVAHGVASFSGRVSEIVPSVEEASRAFLVKVELEEGAEPGRVVPGMFVRVRFTVGRTERLLVPASAVLRRGQLEMVYVVEEDRARLRLVTLGRRRGEDVEVLSGLSAGERVIVEPDPGLRDRARVEAS